MGSMASAPVVAEVSIRREIATEPHLRRLTTEVSPGSGHLCNLASGATRTCLSNLRKFDVLATEGGEGDRRAAEKVSQSFAGLAQLTSVFLTSRGFGR